LCSPGRSNADYEFGRGEGKINATCKIEETTEAAAREEWFARKRVPCRAKARPRQAAAAKTAGPLA